LRPFPTVLESIEAIWSGAGSAPLHKDHADAAPHANHKPVIAAPTNTKLPMTSLQRRHLVMGIPAHVAAPSPNHDRSSYTSSGVAGVTGGWSSFHQYGDRALTASLARSAADRVTGGGNISTRGQKGTQQMAARISKPTIVPQTTVSRRTGCRKNRMTTSATRIKIVAKK
jgi:hypothetical protein